MSYQVDKAHQDAPTPGDSSACRVCTTPCLLLTQAWSKKGLRIAACKALVSSRSGCTTGPRSAGAPTAGAWLALLARAANGILCLLVLLVVAVVVVLVAGGGSGSYNIVALGTERMWLRSCFVLATDCEAVILYFGAACAFQNGITYCPNTFWHRWRFCKIWNA